MSLARQRISAIVPMRDTGHLLRRSVESLFDTGYADLEVVIADDGSSDGSLDVAYDLARQFGTRVLALGHADGRRHGIAATRNLALAHASGELICFLDSDDFVFPYRFAVAVPILVENPDVDAVYERTAIVYEHSSGIDGWVDRGDTFGIAEPVTGLSLLRELLTGRPWHANSVLLRRTLLDRAGLFDPGIGTAEDVHLWVRMAAVGRIRPGCFDRPVSAYVRHAANTFQYRPERRVDMVRAMIDGWRFAQRRRLADEVRATLRAGCVGYVRQGVIAAREAGRPDVAWHILAVAARYGFLAAFARGGVGRQLPHLALESLGARLRAARGATRNAAPIKREGA